MKKGKLTVLACIVTALIFTILLVLVNVVMKTPVENRMFAQLEEFSKLDAYTFGEAPSLSNEPDGDAIAARYCKVVTYEGEEYQVYAYIFSDTHYAKEFFSNVTGRSSDLAGNYSLSGNYFFHTRYIAYSNCNLYMVKGGSEKETVAFVNWLNSSFKLEFNTGDGS